MPKTIVFEMEALQKTSFNGSTGRATQGLWLNHWKETNPIIGKFLKTSNKSRPYSISPLLSPNTLKPIQIAKPTEPGIIYLSIYDAFRFLKSNQKINAPSTVPSPIPSLEAISQHSWLPTFKEQHLNQTIKIADSNWKLTNIFIQKDTSFEELHQIGELSSQKKLQKWLFDFITPTSFKTYDKTLTPLPNPRFLFRHWLQQWNRWAPKKLRIEGYIEELFYLIQISKIKNLNTSHQQYAQQKEIGFTGQITLQPGQFPQQFVPQLATLAHFAPFCGCGIHTTRGMGVCTMQEK